MAHFRAIVVRVARRTLERLAVALLAAAMAFAGVGAAAQAVREDALFQPLEPVADASSEAGRRSPRAATPIPTRGGATVRHREARIDFARLARVKANVESGGSGLLDLNLFDDVEFKAVGLRVERTASGGYSLSGRLDGVPFGTATLVVNGDIVKGSVRTPFGAYTIDAAGDACHIRQVDSSKLPRLAEPLRPPPPQMHPANSPQGAPRPTGRVETANDDGNESVVDVLVVYTSAVTEAVGGVLAVLTMVDLFITETNQAYRDSDVDQQVFLTRAVEVDYEGSNSGLDLERLLNPEDGYLDDVHELRERTGSDLVHLIAESGTVCGIAYLMWTPAAWFERYGFGLTIRNCGGAVFAHELGHNMGLRHDRYVDSTDTPFPYSHGYVNRRAFEDGAPASSRWRTLMAYDTECADANFNCETLLRFSNAEQEHEGDPLGIAEGADAADARRSLNDTRRIVADFREAGPDLVATPLITDRDWSVGQTNTILIGVVTNEGRIESAETTARFYRSPDPTITTDDVELSASVVGVLPAKGTHSATHLETAPEAGSYYYGLCVDAVEGETDTENCSAGLYVTVGPTVSVADARTGEGESLAFPVTLSEVRDTPVEVRWQLQGQTAVAGVDYVDTGGTLTIPAGSTASTISVGTVADGIPEADDTVAITLVDTTPAPPTGVVLSFDGTRATGTIANDDGEPRFPDSELRAAILRALNKPTDGEFTIDELAALKALNASASGDDAKITDLTGLEAATGLESLVLFDNAVSDLTPLGHLGDLRELYLDRNGLETLDALVPLRDILALSLTGNPVEDVAPLTGLTGLARLWLDQTGVTDLGPLAGLTGLTYLNLQCADRNDFAGRAACEDSSITDISPLAGLTALTELNLNFHNVVDISALEGLTRLNFLDLWGNEIRDVGPLRKHYSLYWMDLDDNELTDIEPIGALTGLEALHLNGNRVRDLAPLAGLVDLDTLGLNGNGITDIGHLAGLTYLRLLWLGENEILDISPLARLDGLELLHLDRNGVADISTLTNLFRLRELQLQNNRIRDVSPLTGLRRLLYLDISNNEIRDIEPLVSNGGLDTGDELHVQGNPMTGTSLTVHVPALVDRGVDLTYIGVSVLAGSAPEGEDMEFVVRVSPESDGDVSVNWSTAAVGSATQGDDYPASQSGTVTIAAGGTEATFAVATSQDARDEQHETVEVHLTEAGAFPDGVGLAGAVERDRNVDRATALGLIVDPSGPRADVPLFASASDETRQGFVRVINHGQRNVVHIVAADDAGNRRTTTLAMDPGETVHFNSNDLERGNTGKGLSRGIDEADEVDVGWRLELSGNDVAVLTYMRTNDGFLTSLHDVAPAAADGHWVPIFNPGRNTNQESLLRLINGGEADAEVTITGIDDAGASSGEAGLTLAASEARTVSAVDLENGSNLDGMLGSGSGKWRLSVASDQPILVSSLMQTPTGHLTNLSTVPDNQVAAGDETTHHVYLFPSTADPDARQGFVRVINRGEAGSVSIKAYDDTATDHEPVALALKANETVHFNSADLEAGAARKGLPEGVGAGEGDWRLELTSTLDLDVLAYIRRTEDGFLTSMHDSVPETRGVHRVPIFNPGSNRNQVSQLRLINTGDEAAAVTISGVDDAGQGSLGTVRLSLPAGKVRTVTAQALETGAENLEGALGDGFGKWSLEVNSDAPIHVLNLLASPTGHLTNLSTRPAAETATP